MGTQKLGSTGLNYDAVEFCSYDEPSLSICLLTCIRFVSTLVGIAMSKMIKE
jgi:hypothetical protein